MRVLAAILIAATLATPTLAANWPARTPGPIAGAPGYVQIPNVAVPRDPAHDYKALFHGSKAPADPGKPHGVLMAIGAQMNGLLLGNVPASNLHFAAIFSGPGADTLLTDDAYRAKHGIANPNLPLIAALVKAGLKLYVCGQFMAGADLPRSALIPEVEVAEGATLVKIRLANEGYAILND